MPVGRGRSYLSSMPAALNVILGGWKLNYIFEANTGYPFNLSDIYNMRPNLLPGKSANLPASERTYQRWYDPSAFEWQTGGPNCNPHGWPGCPGNLGRNVLEGPGYKRVDLGISKVFTVREGHNLEFRAEFFNAFNHPNLYFESGLEIARTTTTRVVNPGTGVAPRNAYEQRSIQMGLRYYF